MKYEIPSCFALLLAALFSAAAFGQYPVPAASDPVRVAQEKIRSIDAEVARFEKEASAGLQTSPEWVEAKRAADAATQERDQYRDAALQQTRASDAYASAAAKLAKSEEIIAAGNRGQASSRQVTTATNDGIDARLEISRLESDALKQSPQHRDAELRLKEANTKLNELWKTTKEETIANNRAYRALVANRQSAEQELKVAQDNLRMARQQMAAQQQASRPQRNVTRTPRQRSSGGGGGGRRGGY